MGSVEALQVYWSAPGPLAVLFAHLALFAFLGLAYLGSVRPARKLHVLFSLYAVDVSFWVFLALSFLLCVVLSERLEYDVTGMKVAASLSILGGLTTGGLVGALLTHGRLAREAHLARLGVADSGTLVPGSSPTVVFTDSPGTFAASSSLYDPIVILSRRLNNLLSPEELEAVIAHEAAHIENGDSRTRLVSALLSKCLFFDPLSKLIDPAVHRQGELIADQRVASSATRALALASALRTLALQGSGTEGGVPRGLRSRHVPIEERLRQLGSMART